MPVSQFDGTTNTDILSPCGNDPFFVKQQYSPVWPPFQATKLHISPTDLLLRHAPNPPRTLTHRYG